MNKTGETEGNEGLATETRQALLREEITVTQPVITATNPDPSPEEYPPAMDDARFMAGLIELYKTVLGESAPDHMLKLINTIQEKEAEP